MPDDPYAGLTTTNVTAPAAPPPAAQAVAATTGPAAQATTTYAGSQGYNATGYQGEGYNANTYESTGYTADQADPAAQATATTREVKPNETIQGQLQGIIDSNSPLIQRARARANDSANARGLVNSSMAVQAGEAAAYDVALPIAQFDAGVYGQAARDNQAALTQVSMFNAGEKNKVEMFNTSESNTAQRFTADAKNTAGAFNANAQNQASAFTADARNQSAAFNANAQNQASAFTADAANKASMFNADAANKTSLANADMANANARANAQLITSANLQNADAINKQQLATYDAGVKIAMQNADAANRATLVKLDGVVKTNLAEIEARYKNEMQASATAATLYQSAQQQITAIMTNPDIPAASKTGYINNIINLTRAGMDSAGSLANVDLGRYLNGLSVTQGFDGSSNGGAGSAGSAYQIPVAPPPTMAADNYGMKVNGRAPGVQSDGTFVTADGFMYQTTQQYNMAHGRDINAPVYATLNSDGSDTSQQWTGWYDVPPG